MRGQGDKETRGTGDKGQRRREERATHPLVRLLEGGREELWGLAGGGGVWRGMRRPYVRCVGGRGAGAEYGLDRLAFVRG